MSTLPQQKKLFSRNPTVARLERAIAEIEKDEEKEKAKLNSSSSNSTKSENLKIPILYDSKKLPKQIILQARCGVAIKCNVEVLAEWKGWVDLKGISGGDLK